MKDGSSGPRTWRLPALDWLSFRRCWRSWPWRSTFKLGRPVLFRQVRPGLGEKPFTLYKFRTMTNQRGPDGHLLADHLRMGRFGRLLRSWSLDELPQLWNVLAGTMSLVGPRPLPVRYLPRYTPEQRLRHAVKPGITGWAQVNGRNDLDWKTRSSATCGTSATPRCGWTRRSCC